MKPNSFQEQMRSAFPDIDLRFEELLSKHTSFRIGGAAEVMAFPKSREELGVLLKISKEMDIYPVILGAGTNVLAPDDGLAGLVICLKDGMNGIEKMDATHICVMAGVTMSRAAVYAANAGLAGMEFAHGIPGTVGGGVYMNAGAYGGEIADICERVEVVDREGKIRWLDRQALQFRYRHSSLEMSGEIVIRAVFSLQPDLPENVKAKMKELQARRSASQPLDLPSAGSAFKRPVGGYAAALIEQSGLKGFRVGNAAISEKHAGFAVNLGGATAADVKSLLMQVSDIVYRDSGIRLEPEIRIWK